MVARQKTNNLRAWTRRREEEEEEEEEDQEEEEEEKKYNFAFFSSSFGTTTDVTEGKTTASRRPARIGDMATDPAATEESLLDRHAHWRGPSGGKVGNKGGRGH